jgi:hypothetical protein
VELAKCLFILVRYCLFVYGLLNDLTDSHVTMASYVLRLRIEETPSRYGEFIHSVVCLTIVP